MIPLYELARMSYAAKYEQHCDLNYEMNMSKTYIIARFSKLHSSILYLKENYPRLYAFNEDFFEQVLDNKKRKALEKSLKQAANGLKDWLELNNNFYDANLFEEREVLDTTYKRENTKFGRNDPCHCGSGKKYKRCCANSEVLTPMKTVILAGGFGSRISEESATKPKPMIEIGQNPILWHIMKHYSYFGFNDFIICLGYKGYVIKEFFSNYHLHTSDITFDFLNNTTTIHQSTAEPWKVSLIDTGANSMTGGRIKRIKDYIDDDIFMLTYGDGVSDVDLKKLVTFHKSHGKIATLTAIQPGGRFGVIDINDGCINTFKEKPKSEGGWVNGGFFVLNTKVFDYIEGDDTTFEQSPLQTLAEEGELMAYQHEGFWQAMDTLRDKNYLEGLWNDNNAKWKVW